MKGNLMWQSYNARQESDYTIPKEGSRGAGLDPDKENKKISGNTLLMKQWGMKIF